MRKSAVLLSLALALLVGCAKAPPVKPPPPTNKDWKITVSWNYDFTNYFQCSATVTKGCISGFTWGYISGGTQVPLHTTTTSVCSTATPAACSDNANSQLPVGAFSFYAVANFVDVNGNAGTSPQTTVSQTINAAAVTNFTGSWQ